MEGLEKRVERIEGENKVSNLYKRAIEELSNRVEYFGRSYSDELVRSVKGSDIVPIDIPKDIKDRLSIL